MSKKINSRIKVSNEVRFFRSYKDLVRTLNKLKRGGNKIVLTHGVYDLIHEGHAKYLEIAKSYGDFLVVGMDSDRLTKQRKGPNRPIVPERERVQMLLHLRHVDFVVLRDLDEEVDLIHAVRPNVLVTSHSTTDFNSEKAQHFASYTGKIVTLAPQSTTSTSARIRKLTIDGANSLADEINKLTGEFIEKLRKSK